MFLSDDSETDDEPDKDYKSDEAIELERPRTSRVSHKDIIKYMWKTVLHHGYTQDLASTTVLVCTIDGVHKPIIILGPETHGLEMNLLDQLKENYKGPMKITIYMNSSPCPAWAKPLKEFLEENVNISLILHVTHLSNIRRKSCELRRDAGKFERHIYDIERKVHEAHFGRLRDLMSLGGNRCRIESFTKEVWEALLAVMDMSEESRKRIMRAYGLKFEHYDRSRQGEDRRIRKDLNHIKSHSDPWHGINKNDSEEI